MQPICLTEDDVIRECGDARVLLIGQAPVGRRVMERLPKVKCLVRYGVGVDTIDLAAAKELGVTVANVRDYCIDEVSDHAIAMALSLVRRIPQDHNGIANGGWSTIDFLSIQACSDMTFGLMGFGKIARRVAEKARVFGFNMIAHDPVGDDDHFASMGVKRVDLETLLTRSDLISLHCPLTPETRHMINRDSIAKMKPGVLLVNTSRGAIALESDLVEALKSGQISGAGLDVYEGEFLAKDSSLRSLNNVILTSHAAWASRKSISKNQQIAAEAALSFLQGKRPTFVVV